MTARDTELAATRVGPWRSIKALDATTRSHASFRSELNALHATAERLDRVLRDFAERFCTNYSRLMRTHSVS